MGEGTKYKVIMICTDLCVYIFNRDYKAFIQESPTLFLTFSEIVNVSKFFYGNI